MTIDDGVAYGEPFQKGDRVAAVRRQRRPARRRARGEGHRDDDRRGVRRLGFDLLVQRRRAAHSGRDDRRVSRSARAAVRHRRVHRGRQRHRSTIRATTSGSASTICSSAKKAVGQVTGTLALRGQELSGEIDAASPRLAMTGTGRIALTPQLDAELTFRFHDSSLDPYVRAVRAEAVAVHDRRRQRRRSASSASWPTSIICSSTARSTRSRCACSTTRIDSNAAPIRLALDRQRGHGRGAAAGRRGHAAARRGPRRPAARSGSRCKAAGDANLGILQGFFRDVRGSRRAPQLTGGRSTGRLRSRCFPGSATIADGRIRHFSLPERARRHQRHDPLRLRRHPPRRCGGDAGRRTGAVRRPRSGSTATCRAT